MSASTKSILQISWIEISGEKWLSWACGVEEKGVCGGRGGNGVEEAVC